jgi:NADP-dependent 3-hydroxy acid dehydrogenase YdfG
LSTARTETDRVLSGLLEDKVAILTGASRGIGAAAARAFAPAGAAVVLAARDQHDLTSVAEETPVVGEARSPFPPT